jgi:hypothetical protein
MKTLTKLYCFLSLLLCAVSVFAEDAPAPTFSSEHLAEAERVVYAMGIPERFIIPTKELLKRSREIDPENSVLMAAVFDPYLEKKYTAQQLRGFIAAQFDLDTCRQVAQFWEGPVGKKLVNNQIRMLATGNAPKLTFTAREKALIKKFETTPSGQAFLQALPMIEDTLLEYTEETHKKMREKFLTELKRQADTSKSS